MTRGEDGVGTWTIIIKDGVENEFSGSLIDWSITLWGEAVDAEKAKLLPLPGGNEAEDQNSGAGTVSTSTADAQTTDLPTSTSSNIIAVTGDPTDHVTRPINSKPNNGNTPSQTVTGLSDPLPNFQISPI